MATQFNVALVGMKSRTEKARIGAEVVGFMDVNHMFVVTKDVTSPNDQPTKSITLKTAKSTYTLAKSLIANRYEGTCGNIRVHVVLNKIVGKVIYWVK